MHEGIQYQLDPLDREILEALTRDARQPFVQLARQLNVSNSLVHQRVRKLREAGIIREAMFPLDPERLGYQTCAYTQILLTDATYLESATEALRSVWEVVECVNIAGRYAIMVKIYARNNSHFRDLLYESIHTIAGVEGTHTTIVFETSFRRTVPVM